MSKATFDALMERLNKASRLDQEEGHIEADSILVDALIDAARNDLDEAEAWQIVEAYSNISKWYA